MNSLLPDLIQWATDVAYSFGYVGIAVLVALGNLHLPIPTELTLPLAGFLVAQGRFSFTLALIWTTAAAVSTSLLLYVPGRLLSEERLRRLVRRFGRFVLVYESDLDRASELFKQQGWKAILLGRLIPGVGTLISIPAGLYRMPILGWFMFFTFLDSVLWNAMLIGLGWWLGSQWMLVERYARIVEYPVLAAIVVGVFWFVWRRWKARKR
jgi:membrane protein DedA with SNARE-associated domain